MEITGFLNKNKLKYKDITAEKIIALFLECTSDKRSISRDWKNYSLNIITIEENGGIKAYWNFSSTN